MTIKNRFEQKANQLRKNNNPEQAFWFAVLEILDLEDQKMESNIPCHPGHVNSIQIEEWADEKGFLKSVPPEEQWIESIKRESKLDVRAILSPLPEELGLFSLDVVYVEKEFQFKKARTTTIKVWVVPAPE